MRSENYVYFWTNPYIKLYTLCMADIVMLYSSLRRSAGAMAGDSLGPGSALGKRQKTGYSKKKNGERSESSFPVNNTMWGLNKYIVSGN